MKRPSRNYNKGRYFNGINKTGNCRFSSPSTGDPENMDSYNTKVKAFLELPKQKHLKNTP